MGPDEHQRTGPGSRLALLIACLAIMLVASAAFGRVYQGRYPTLALMAAAAGAILVAGLLERWNVLVSVVATVAGLAVAVGLLIYPETTWWGLPTPDTWERVQASWAAVGRVARSEVPPALPLAPLLLASITATWAAAFATHALAVRAASPFLALFPAGALLAFASLVVQDGSRPLYVVLFLAAAMGLLFADGLRRVGQWGPVSVWSGPRRWRRTAAAHTRAARRVALACLLLAVFAPGILPGYRADGILSAQGFGGLDHISIDPIVDIRPSLLRNPAIEVFTVQSDRPAYWRFMALNEFTGRHWLARDAYAADGVAVGGGSLEPLTRAESNVTILHQHFEYSRLVQPWLVAAFDPVAISSPDSSLRYDPETSTIVDPNGTSKELTYDVTSRYAQPTPEQLDQVSGFEPWAVQRFTALPADTPPQVLQIAQGLTADEPTHYRKILAIQRHLRSFRYDESVEAGHATNDVLQFLTQTQAGFCEQFAGSMAVLLRSLGIPARVAVGFTSGTYDKAADVWRVGTNNAHTWVEVLFPSYGWLAFEPTPGRGNPSASPYQIPPLRPGSTAECLLVPGAAAIEGACGREGGASRPDPTSGGPSPAPGARPVDPKPVEQPSRGAGQGVLGRIGGWDAVPWVGLGLGVALVLGLPVAKVFRRRRALARAVAPRERVLAAYGALGAEAADLGLPRRRDETLVEYRRRLRDRVAFSNGHLDRLTALAGRAAYSDRDIEAEAAESAVQDLRQAAHDLRRWAGVPRRVLGLYRVRLPARR